MRVLRVLVLAAGVGLALLGGAVLCAAAPAGRGLARLFEAGLSNSLGARVEVGRAAFRPWRAQLMLHDLSVSNPPGFKEGEALRFDLLTVDFDPHSLLGMSPRVALVDLRGGSVALHVTVAGDTNLGALANNASRRASPMRRWTPRVMVEELRCGPTDVRLSPALLPRAGVSFRVASFRLTQLREGAVPARDTVAIFLKSLLMEVLTVGGLLRPGEDRAYTP